MGKRPTATSNSGLRQPTREPRVASELVASRPADLGGHEECRALAVSSGSMYGYDINDLIEISESHFQGVEFTSLELGEIRITDTVFEDCEFSGTDLANASLIRVEFRRSRGAGMLLSAAKLTDVRFSECKLDDANFRMGKFDRTIFEDSSLRGADFSNSQGTDVAFFDCQLDECDYTKARLAHVALNGSTLDAIRSATALGNATIGSDQQIPFAMKLLTESGVRVNDDRAPT